MDENAYDVEDAGGGYTVAAQFPGADTDPNTNPNTSTDVNSPFKKGDVFVNQTPISTDLSSNLAAAQKFITDNKAWLATAGALTSAFGGSTDANKKTGYQGGIPALGASRSMFAAPPPTGYRPGQGGINYGGDVTYTRTPGMDPWSQLSGNSAYAGAGGSNDSGLTALLKAYQGLDGGSNLTSLNNSVVTANNTLLTTNNQNAAAVAAAKAATAAQTAAAQAAAKAASDLAAAQAAGNAAAIAAAQKAASDAAAAKATADAVAAKAKADALAAAKAASDAAAAKTAADAAAADAAAKAKAKADADAKTAATEGSFLTAASTVKKLNSPVASANDINSWILNNPNASASEIAAAAKAGNVSNTDIQRALSLSTFSPAVQYSILNGQGLDKLNSNITQWVNSHPYATAAEIAAIKKASGVSDQDVANALTEKTASAGKEYALTHGMGLDEYYKNILNYQAGNHTAAETAAAAKTAGVSQADIDAAAKFAQRQKEIDEWNAQNAPTTQAKTQATTEKAPDLNASIASILADKKATTPDMNSSLASILAERKAAETPSKPDNSNDIFKYFSDPETQAALASGNTRGIAETMQSLGWSPAEVASATGSNPDEVQAAYDAAISSSKVGAYDPYSEAFAEGGMAKGRYLQGATDGMADKLPARIGNNQPAALSHGEFVIPADVVSHMGNGNSDAGAKKLYQMMDKIRMARTGNKKQGKRIDPDKFMPGGLAQAYASGGSVKHFLEGGSTTTPAANYNAGLAGVESNLSNWAGPYVTNMLGQGQALANMPYQAYMGQLTAGESPLQTSAFSNAAGLETPSSIGQAATTAGAIGTKAKDLSYAPTTFDNQYKAPTAYQPTTSSFDASQAQAYMNPYLQASLNPQLEEARRQSQITQTQNAGKMTQAGAYGGSRQAILDAENQRSLGTNLANITGQGYNTAYGNAMSQFNADQARKMQEAQFGSQQGMANAQLGAQYGLAGQQAGEQSKQYGAGYGLQGLQTGLQAAQAQGGLGVQQNQADINNLNAQLTAGGQQRGIESEGIAADKAQFEEARANPYKMVQYQQSLLQGLPLAAQSYQGIEPSALMKASQGATTVNQLLKNLNLI